MSNNEPDSDDLDIENFDEGGFDDYSKKGTLGDLWRNNPMVKIGVILAGIAIIVGAIILFGGSKDPLPTSQLAGGSEVNEAPGTSEISSTMQDAIQEDNIQRVEDATRTGGSALPIPIEPSKGALPIPVEEASGEDPLERWRRMQEERVRQQELLAQAPQPAVDAPPPVDTRTPAVNALSESMVSQMQAILQNPQIQKPNYKSITSIGYLENLQAKKFAAMQAQQQAILASQAPVNEQVENILLPAGTIEYGQLLLEANTDAPGPVLAQIVSGPLKGARVLGSFQSTDEYLVLNFGMIVIDGINYPVEAVAVDPATTLPGLITEVDRRYLKRIILPAAAAFIEGLTDAISESGSTSIIIDGNTVSESTSDKDSGQEVASGISEAGEKLSEILDEEADATRPMLRVASGTPIGVLFISPVTDLATGR